eukprot:snap_masked-scaffold_18-processed-gene-2.42-mRNA-1 protein AED:1.00 eAED:1.00 QI:0/0/0/0/1/1/3/0/70
MKNKPLIDKEYDFGDDRYLCDSNAKNDVDTQVLIIEVLEFVTEKDYQSNHSLIDKRTIPCFSLTSAKRLY